MRTVPCILKLAQLQKFFFLLKKKGGSSTCTAETTHYPHNCFCEDGMMPCCSKH